MKKKILALFLVLVMLFAAGCSNADPEEATVASAAPVEEAEVPETEATVPETEATVPETEAAKAEAPKLTLDVTQQICFPAVKTIGNATLADSGMLDDSTGYLIYSNADDETLEMFISMCSYCGIFRYGGTQEDGSTQYYLMRPGSAYLGVVTLYPEDGELVVQTAMDIVEIQEEQMQKLIDYYMQDLVMPSGYGPNVHPEFFASIGRTGADSAALVDNYFGGEQDQCWREVYAKVDYPTLHKYLSDMMLCGFDIRCESIEFNDEGVLDTTILWLDNGSSQLFIIYYASSGMANLFYQPGIDRYLLKDADYAMYMPHN